MGERGFGAVSVSHRAQQIIAITLGVVLIGVVTTTLIRDNYSNNPTSTDNGSGTAIVDENTQTKEENEEPAKDDNEEITNVAKVFTFTAQPGASYTALARDAVRQFAAANNVTLTDAQVEKAAARLAYNAGSPYLEIGQVVVISSSDVSAILGIKVDTTPPKEDTATPPTDSTNKTPPAKSYTFVAQPGDAYCLFARSAISDYNKANNLNLTGAQRIAAETFIISDAGFPRLTIGQQVTFSHDTIKNAVDKAMSLSPSQLDNWQPYADLAGL